MYPKTLPPYPIRIRIRAVKIAQPGCEKRRRCLKFASCVVRPVGDEHGAGDDDSDPLRSGRTGDLGGNLARIDRELRRIRFPVAFDEDGAREGSPMALLPALHYAMLGFSRHVTRSLSDEGHDLQAKSDSRFVENAWKALRESFHYNPTLTPTQFLSPGFAERKLLLLADAIELCKRRHNEHARGRARRGRQGGRRKEGGPASRAKRA